MWLGGTLNELIAENCCGCYHNPREWEKALAENFRELVLFGQILGQPVVCKPIPIISLGPK